MSKIKPVAWEYTIPGDYDSKISKSLQYADLQSYPNKPIPLYALPDTHCIVPKKPDQNMQMSGIKALLPCTNGELECIGDKLLDAYIAEVTRVYKAMITAYQEEE